MKLTTKKYADEISWTIDHCSSVRRYGDYQNDIERCCLEPGVPVTLTCLGSTGDGWNGGFIKIQGNTFCEDFLSGTNQTHEVTIHGRLLNIIWMTKDFAIFITLITYPIRLHFFRLFLCLMIDPCASATNTCNGNVCTEDSDGQFTCDCSTTGFTGTTCSIGNPLILNLQFRIMNTFILTLQ